MKLIILCSLLLSMLSAQLPVSRQAKIVEVVSSSEVMIEATGIYKGKGKKSRHKKKDVEKNGISKAILDSKRAAIHFLLFGGTDPIITKTEEKQKFESYEADYFGEDIISNYFTYEDVTLRKKVKIDGGEGLKLVKRFKVNKDLIIRNLENSGVIIGQTELATSMGNPFIMVLPSVKKGQSPIDLLTTNKFYRHAATVVESYLTAKQYDVLVPEQVASLEELNKAQLDLGDREEDYAYQLALSIGSDVYIEFDGASEDAGYGTKKYGITLRAYETTTGRLLGSETGYSQGRKGESMVSVEEAMNDAIDKVLSRVNSYWKSDLSRGIQYKLVINLSTEFDEDEIEEVQFAVMDAIEEVANKSKENIVTAQTLDYLIWCDGEKFDKSSKIYRYIKKYFKKEGTSGVLRRVNVNRKMVILKVDYE